MHTKDFAIGILTVTAVILLATVVILSVVTPRQAQGFAMLDEGSGYTMYTSQVQGSQENLNIINHRMGLLNIYRYDYNTGKLTPQQQIPLPPVSTSPTPPAGRPRMR